MPMARVPERASRPIRGVRRKVRGFFGLPRELV